MELIDNKKYLKPDLCLNKKTISLESVSTWLKKPEKMERTRLPFEYWNPY